MAEVIDFGITYDEALQTSAALSEAADTGRDQLEAATADLASRGAAVHAQVEALHTGFATLTHTLQEMQAGLDSAEAEMTPLAASLQQALTTSTSNLEQAMHTVQTTQETFVSTLATTRSTFDGEMSTLEHACVDTTAALAQLTTSLHEAQTATQTSCQDFSTALVALQQRVQTFQTDMEAGFTQLSTHLEGHITPHVDTLLQDLGEQLLRTHAEQMVSHMTDFAQQMTHVCETFQSDVAGVGDRFITRGNAMLSDLASHCQDSLQHKLQRAIDEIVLEVVRALIREVVDTVVMAELGVATTSALSPVLPELLLAKGLVTAINEARRALQTLNPFG